MYAMGIHDFQQLFACAASMDYKVSYCRQLKLDIVFVKKKVRHSVRSLESFHCSCHFDKDLFETCSIPHLLSSEVMAKKRT